MSSRARSEELRRSYEAEGVAEHYAGARWQGSRHARRTHRKELRLVAELLEQAAQESGPLGTVLDVPCGAGRFQALLRLHGERLLGADIARPMVGQTGDSVAARGRSEPLGLVQASADRLPLAEDAVDLVFCFRLLHHYPRSEQRRSVLAELGRVSRRWALVSYFDAASFQAWRHRVRKRRTVRFAQPNAEFEAEAAAAGFRVRERRWIARGISEQVLALLERRP